MYPSQTIPKLCRGRILRNSFQKARTTLMPKLDKDITQKRNLQINITDEKRCKNSQKNIRKPNPTILEKDKK